MAGMGRPTTAQLGQAFRAAGGFAAGGQNPGALLSHPSILEVLQEPQGPNQQASSHDSRPWATLFGWLFVGEAAHDSLDFLLARQETERSGTVGVEGLDRDEMALMWTTLASA